MSKIVKDYYIKMIKNHNQGRIAVSNMQMTTPYYPESLLAKSKFFGFYTLFYMFTIYFSIVYPALNYLKTGNFFEKALFKMLQTNLFWDLAAILIFLLLSFCLMSLTTLTKTICKNLNKTQTALIFIPAIGILWLIYIGIGFYIVRNFPMYFTDKIFIVVLSWAFFIKTLSYIFDLLEIVQITQRFQVKRQEGQKQKYKLGKQKHDTRDKYHQKQTQGQKQRVREQLKQISLVKKSSNLLSEQSIIEISKTKLIYLISPEIIFKRFILNYDKTLTIHPIYIINKAIVSLLCSFVNLIIMIQIIQPMCEKQSLEKYQLIQLFFKFIPPIFYINICLYLMILENILPAIAQVTKMRSRIYYHDWWNAQTLYDFLDKWVLLINSFTKEYLTLFWKNKNLRETIHVAIVFFLNFEIFSISERSVSLLPFCALGTVILLLTYFLGGNQKIQNNHIVHIIIFSFSPLMLAIQMKYNIFTGGAV